MNSPDESSLIHYVRQHLDASLPALPREQKDRLRAARELSLRRQKQPVFFAQLATLGIGAYLDVLSQRALARFAVLLLVSGMMAFWHAQSYVVDLQELDSAILTDEMPMDVLTNKGFNEWLLASAEP